jgi:hypothetical protein
MPGTPKGPSRSSPDLIKELGGLFRQENTPEIKKRTEPFWHYPRKCLATAIWKVKQIGA